MTSLEHRLRRLEEMLGGAIFTLENVVMASFGDPAAIAIMDRVAEDHAAGRLTGRSQRVYGLLLDFARAA
jgi:hypothetical protein